MSALPFACASAYLLLGGDPGLWTPPLPPAPITDDSVAPREAIPEILFVNFDGAVLQSGCGNDAHHDCSTLANLFDGYVAPFQGDVAQRLAILQATRRMVNDFGIRVVTDRPPDDVDYTMVLYGRLGIQSFAGIAPYIDCEDRHPNDTSFAQAFLTSSTGSTVILQEAAHTWGLEHVDSEFDVLNPFKSSKNQEFVDACYRIVASTELDPTAGTCNLVHTRYCDPGFQNSHQEMLNLFGPAIPDLTPPKFEITYPEDGDVFVSPVTFALLGETEDDLDPQYYGIQVFSNDKPIGAVETDVALDLSVSNPPPGDYVLRVAITDQAGNPAEDTVHFTVLPEGSELPSEDTDGLDVSEGGGCRIATQRETWGALGLIGWVLGVARRRRRARPR